MFDLIPMSGRERSVWNYFDNWEKNFFQNVFSGDNLQLRTDVIDDGDKYVLSAELPGFHREDIRIELDQGLLTISAEHSEEKEEKRGQYIRRERRLGSYKRSFDVSGINTDAIDAKYENGVLRLNLPKKDAAPIPPAKQIAIQ